MGFSLRGSPSPCAVCAGDRNSGIGMREIVLAIMASTDGFIHLPHLQPDLVDVELVVETQWGIM